MKKAFKFSVPFLLLVLTICGCTKKQVSSEDLESQIAELQAQLENQKDSSDKIEDGVDTISEESDEKEEAREAESVSLNEKVTTDFVEFTFDKVSTAQTIKPQKPDTVYTYLADQDNETYIYVRGTIKNTGTSTYEVADSPKCKILVDDKYEYGASVSIDEGDDLSYLYSYLNPFGSATFYICASVPDELINQYSKVQIFYGFNENFYDDYKTTIDNCDYLYTITASK